MKEKRNLLAGACSHIYSLKFRSDGDGAADKEAEPAKG